MTFIGLDLFRKIKNLGSTNEIQSNLNRLRENLVYSQQLVNIGSFTYDLVKDELYWSDEVYKIMECGSEEFKGTLESYYSYIHPEDREAVIESVNYALEGKEYDIEYRIITQTKPKHIQEKTAIIFDENNNPQKIIGIIHDITEEKIKGNNLKALDTDFSLTQKFRNELESKQNQINKALELFKALARESYDIITIITSNGSITYISDSVFEVIGFRPKEIIGRNIYELFDELQVEKLSNMIKQVSNSFGDYVHGKFILKAKDGGEISLECLIQNLLNEPSIEGIVLYYRDVTEIIKLKDKIAKIAYRDELTGLPNRTSFKDNLKVYFRHAKESQRKFGLIMLDIDGLKYINLSLGYEFGNEIILEITKRLKLYLDKDVFISRYLDNHFAILLSEIESHEEYEILIKGIINMFIVPLIIGEYSFDISANIGVCFYNDNLSDEDMLERNAQIALLRAKKEGKNTYQFYSSNMDIQNYKETTLRNDLHYAIERNQFRIYYQPIVNLNNNEILSAEALIRWEHPEWGMLSPKEFIPLAEENGMIIHIGKWVLREVCINFKKWLDNNLPKIKVSINVSSIQFLEKNFVENMKKIIDEYKLDYRSLIVEITESVLLEKTEKVISDIKKLQSKGIEIALDDFGTGFSSLSMLSSFKIDILKIDGSFIKKIPIDSSSSAITQYTINLAKDLKMKLIAEGIETWEQSQYLRKLSCNIGQGYLYSKPLPLTDFEDILINKRCNPIIDSNSSLRVEDERRKFFRVEFQQMLEAKLTIIEINKKKLSVGNSLVLVKNIGPGGLSFISNIKFPVDKTLILQIKTQLINTEIIANGYPVWVREIDNNLFRYGIEFTIDENDRVDLIQILNLVQIKMKNNILFAEGSFISGSYKQYFSSNMPKEN